MRHLPSRHGLDEPIYVSPCKGMYFRSLRMPAQVSSARTVVSKTPTQRRRHRNGSRWCLAAQSFRLCRWKKLESEVFPSFQTGSPSCLLSPWRVPRRNTAVLWLAAGPMPSGQQLLVRPPGGGRGFKALLGPGARHIIVSGNQWGSKWIYSLPFGCSTGPSQKMGCVLLPRRRGTLYTQTSQNHSWNMLPFRSHLL